MFGKFFDWILFAIVTGYVAFNAYSFYEMFSPAPCVDPGLCISPAYPGNELMTLEGYFLETKGKISFHEFVLPPFDVLKGLKWPTEIRAPLSVFKNGTALCHLRIQSHEKVDVFTKDIMVALHRQPSPKAYNLISSQNSVNVSDTLQITTHWLSHLQIYALKDAVSFAMNSIPHELMQHFHMSRSNSRLVYLPLFHVDPQLQPAHHWIELPEVPVQSLNFTVEVIPLSIGKFRLRCIFAQASDQLKSMGVNRKDIEDIQAIFTETNLYLLLTTLVVSVFHLFFDFLSFKNDVQFWRNTENTIGISVRTIIWRCISTTIIFLYLYEENSSLLVVIPSGISMVIEFWKFCRIAKVSFCLRDGFSVGRRNREERETDELDAYFVRRLMCFMLPFCIFGAVYSLLYMPHRGWRSWILLTAANGVYAFGFLLMTPQLFINYKLKSVAHLPWRALTYKAFNTFIDDFFAFVIKMPTAHRLACFRDDIVFVIYMYQRWLYPVDQTRVNELEVRRAVEEKGRRKGLMLPKKLKIH